MLAPAGAPSLVELFQRAAAQGGERPFLWAKQDGVWRPWSWRRVASEARALSQGLRAKGLAPGDRVLLVAENRPEWAIADLAVIMAGGITVPAFTTNTTPDHDFLLGHSGAVAAVVSNKRQAERLYPAIQHAEAVRLVVTMEPVADEVRAETLAWNEALALGEQAGEGGYDPGAHVGRDDIACFIYTSGTGGIPKGVMLSHGNVLANVESARQVLELVGLDDEVFLSFLPLSHAYEHTAGQFLPMAVGAQIYYAEGIEALASNLVEARPTIMTCVPRLYEAMRQRILKTMARQTGLRPRLFHKAVELGTKAYERPDSLGLAERLLHRALDRLVRDTVRARFGGRIKALVSGGAPLNYDVGLFFTALGLPLFQGYGQTECSPVVSVNVPGKVKLHTVGPPLPGLEVRIAADGEILVRGDAVMRGYYRDEAATEAALRNGWLHTGDVGHLDNDGYIQITDRKRDIIVNSGGDNVAPQRVEGVLNLEPEIGQVIVFGDRRPHLVALIVPDREFVNSYAREHGCPPDLARLADEPEFRKALGGTVARANRNLSVIERIRRFHVMKEPFTIEGGFMTPTMKLKRQKIYREFARLLESLYEAHR